LPVEDFSSNGELCLNCLCQPRGQAQKGGIIHKDCKLAEVRQLRDQIEGKTKRQMAKKSRTAVDSGTKTRDTATTASVKSPLPQPLKLKNTAEAGPSPTENGQERPGVEKAAAERPVNTLALHVVADNPPKVAAANSTKAASESPLCEKCHISIVVNKPVVDQNEKAVNELKAEIEPLVTKYAFITAVELEIAA
jgi:hypothetical protein